MQTILSRILPREGNYQCWKVPASQMFYALKIVLVSQHTGGIKGEPQSPSTKNSSTSSWWDQTEIALGPEDIEMDPNLHAKSFCVIQYRPSQCFI